MIETSAAPLKKAWAWYDKECGLILPILFALVSGYGASIEPGALPDPNLTPGAALEVTKDDVCTVGYTKNVRNVPVAVKRRVYEV
jgi:hypothetical protein